MVADSKLTGILIGGIHASRPAATAVVAGSTYSCTTHGLEYQSDGATWSTRSTFGSAASGSITASGYTQSTARLLGRTTASTGAVEEITVGTGLSLSAGSLTATGGAGLTQAYAGYNTIGGTWESPGSNSMWFLKSITLANDCLITSIGAYSQSGAGISISYAVGLFSDSAGAPLMLLGGLGFAPQISLNTNGARWLDWPLGIWVVAGTYWIGVRSSDTGGSVVTQIAYDGSGSDVTKVQTTGQLLDMASVTTTTRKYSIRANTIR